MRLKYALIFSLFLILIFVGFKISKNAKEPFPNSTLPVHEVKHYDEKSFIEGIGDASKNYKTISYNISGAVVNHHLIASYIIADVFNKISAQNPKTIIILGPNHYEKGNFDVLTSKYIWNTKYGVVEPEENIINGLLSKNLAKLDEEAILNDHATTSLLPFVKFYMPSVKIVQLLISKKLTLNEAEILSGALSVYVKNGAVIIASTDFSHYLTAGQANIRDEETLKAINSFDYNALFSFNSDHLDSPGSMATLLMTMQKIGKTKQEIIYHANSATINPNFDSFTTSYFSMFYH